MHRAAYAHLGLDWTYDAVDVEPGGLAELVRGLDTSWRGWSVTAPHKRDALTLADHASDVARRTGAANTLLLEDGVVTADNTDVPGAVAAWRERGVTAVTTVRILGAGATAASTALAARELGATGLDLRVRQRDRAQATAEIARVAGLEVTVAGLDEPLRDDVDLLVSTVPEDVAASRATELVGLAAAVFDVVYDPWPTALASAAQHADRILVDGLDLLAHQASLQVELMTGAPVAVDLLRSAALTALG